MITKTIETKTVKTVCLYEFKDLDTKGNYLVMWRCPIRYTDDPAYVLKQIHKSYIDLKDKYLVGDVRGLLNNYDDGGIEDTFFNAFHSDPECANEQILVYDTVFAITKEMGCNGKSYLTMYDYIEYDTLQKCHSNIVKANIKTAFANALNNAIAPYVIPFSEKVYC